MFCAGGRVACGQTSKMHKVVYVTDPEGNLEYFSHCIHMSNGAYYQDGDLILRKDWMLVVSHCCR